MSDQIYRERAARRTRLILATVAIVVAVGCAVAAGLSAFVDDCTGGFDRAPEAVVRAYARAVSGGDGVTARRCWVPQAYFDMESGCSEFCLGAALGGGFEVVGLEVSPAAGAPPGRARLAAQVMVACESGELHSGVLTLDGLSRDLPWRHWKIIRSEMGGSYTQPWCGE